MLGECLSSRRIRSSDMFQRAEGTSWHLTMLTIVTNERDPAGARVGSHHDYKNTSMLTEAVRLHLDSSSSPVITLYGQPDV